MLRYLVWIEGYVPRPRRRALSGAAGRQLPKHPLDLVAAVNDLSGGRWDVIQDGLLVFYTHLPRFILEPRLRDAVGPPLASTLELRLTGWAESGTRFEYSPDLDSPERDWVRDGLESEWARLDAAAGN